LIKVRLHNEQKQTTFKKSLGTTFVSEATSTARDFASNNTAMIAMKTKGFLPLQTTVKGLTRQEFTVNHIKDKTQPPNLTINSFRGWDDALQDR
jgi:ribosomal protein S11